ncbi:MAG: cysteine--tRNA ligase [Eubacteriales bacterium]
MKVFNTQTKQKEELKPVEEGKIRLYACGPTVYNYIHIGNARPLITFDTLRRYLEYRGYDVNFVQNFTDIDDKMIQNANLDGTTVKDLAEKYIAEYYNDAKSLNVKAATHHPKATEHMDDIIALIQKLIDKGLAYAANGDVYYNTKAFKDYGKLSGQSIDDLESGARIEVNEEKQNPIDFALWKAKKEGEPAWESPWGEGRPGWHIECSAMSMKYLGETIDIHGGGQDLIFPHHENEVAQSEGATGQEFCHYWMHNGYINVDNKKMSKSLGNFFTVRDILAKYDGIVVRFFMLSAHYRSPVNFSDGLLEQAKSALERIKNFKENLNFIIETDKAVADMGVAELNKTYSKKFNDAMDDDLNTADAIGVIFEYIKEINVKFENGANANEAKLSLELIDTLLDVLGLIVKGTDEIPEEILKLVEERKTARAEKNWAKADEIRDQLTEKGYEVKDTPDGAKISKL